MRNLCFASGLALFFMASVVSSQAADDQSAPQADEAAIQRTRDKVNLLDNIFKQTVVLITDKYVHGEDDFAAGSAAVLLFKNISEAGDDKVRLIDATGTPYDEDNVARDAFEKVGIKKLKAGAKRHEEVEMQDDQAVLRVLTPVPVVMEKCIMCHAHYADVPAGQAIGAISYTVPIK
ncbi:MAG: DUF3365 domain-containing protein [Planctomycetales bacterium]|nr:DUF3365 domain-containing protein [Planctomycetales bacterium]